MPEITENVEIVAHFQTRDDIAAIGQFTFAHPLPKRLDVNSSACHLMDRGLEDGVDRQRVVAALELFRRAVLGLELDPEFSVILGAHGDTQ
jgi:hypothetical protein